MKLLYATNTRFPSERAHAIQIAHMCQAFSQNNIEVTLVTGDRRTGKEKGFKETFGFTPTFDIKKVRFGLLFLPSIPMMSIVNSLFFAIFSVISIPLKSFGFFYFRDEWLAFFFLLFVAPKKIIFESHEAKYNFAVRQLVRRGVKLIVISEGIKDFYISKEIPEQQILVAHDGIDESFFHEVETKEGARTRLGIVGNKPVVMYIGGLDEWKGVKVFLEASEHNDLFNFVVIGGKEDEIHEYRKRYAKVSFLGARPYSELKDNQQAADILVIPNTATNDLSSKYTSPLKLFAHLASGVPLVVADIPSLRSVVSDATVYFFIPDDSLSLSQVLTETLFNSGATAKGKSKNAFELSRSYTWEKRVRTILSYIDMNLIK